MRTYLPVPLLAFVVALSVPMASVAKERLVRWSRNVCLPGTCWLPPDKKEECGTGQCGVMENRQVVLSPLLEDGNVQDANTVFVYEVGEINLMFEATAEQLVTLKANVKALSDANDALSRRVNDLEAELRMR